MLQFSPGEYIPITRQLEDPTDTTTRYVRAYVYKHKGGGAGTLLATLDLVDKTGQRFEYLYQTPQDSDPYTLEVIIKVFDDSGYTTESNRYERGHQIYLVAERWGMMYRSGGGVDVNYDKVRRIVEEEIGQIPKSVQKEIDLNPLLRALNEVNKNIKSIRIPEVRIPEPEKINLEPIIRSIEKVREDLSGKITQEISGIPEPERADFTPISERIKNLEDQLSENTSSLDEKSKELVKSLKEILGEVKKFQGGFDVQLTQLGKAKLSTQEEKSPEPVKKRRAFI